jgi:antitoxin ParD1/3/4/toxin ParE1/3/4
MTARYVLAPQAAQDLVEIWRYIYHHSSLQMANHVEFVIRQRIEFLSKNPGAGHRRRDLTEKDVRFFPVYSYLVVYRSQTKPLQVVTILHGRRDLEGILKGKP